MLPDFLSSGSCWGRSSGKAFFLASKSKVCYTRDSDGLKPVLKVRFLLRLPNFGIIFSKFYHLCLGIDSKIYKKFCSKFETLATKVTFKTGLRAESWWESRVKSPFFLFTNYEIN